MGQLIGDRRIYNLNIALIVVTTVIVAMRLYSRGVIAKALGIDDWLACVTYVLAIALSCLEIRAIFVGSGASLEVLTLEQRAELFSLRPVTLLVFFAGLCFMRLSFLAFLSRLSKSRTYIRCILVVGFVVVCMTAIALAWLLTECTPIKDVFNAGKLERQCRPREQEGHMVLAHGAVGIGIEVCLFILPIWIVRKNLMKVDLHTAKVFLVFAVGIFTIILGIVRLAKAVTIDFEEDTSLKMAPIVIWTDLEVHVGLWCGCFAALQPLIRLAFHGLNLRSRLGSSKTPILISHRDRGVMLHNCDMPGFSKCTKTHGEADNEETDGASSSRVIIHIKRSSITDGMELNDLRGDAGIMKRTDVDVKIEEGLSTKDRGEVKDTWNAF